MRTVKWLFGEAQKVVKLVPNYLRNLTSFLLGFRGVL